MPSPFPSLSLSPIFLPRVTLSSLRQTRMEREIDQSQVSVSKLSEAMQTVNRVIGGKIKEGKRTVSNMPTKI